MSQSATLPTREHLTREKHDPEVTAPLLTQSLEDRHLAERVECALRARGYRALDSVRASVRAQVVVLRGRVASYYLKQIAQATALAVPGTRQIRNDVDVVQPK